MNPDLVLLPNGIDLWRAPQHDANGNIIARPDNISLENLPLAPKMSPDVAALMLAGATGPTAAPQVSMGKSK